MTSEIDRLSYDVVVIGAGGSGLRAAIEARLNGKKTAIISKSLFGKAHTVMAEGGCAAAMGNVNPNDNWQVHFRDTLRGGKFLNNPRMAELHAKEAPDRVLGARGLGRGLRPDQGRQDQPAELRRAHLPAAGPRRRPDRPGDDPDAAAEGRRDAAGRRGRARRPGGDDQGLRRDHDHPPGQGRGSGSPGPSGTSGTPAGSSCSRRPRWCWRPAGSGRPSRSRPTPGSTPADGHALALMAGGPLLNMEFVQFHPTAHGLAAVGGRPAGHRVGAR